MPTDQIKDCDLLVVWIPYCLLFLCILDLIKFLQNESISRINIPPKTKWPKIVILSNDN